MGASVEQFAVGDPPEAGAGEPISPAELTEIYEQHFAFVWRSLRALGVAPSTLDDAVQEVFLVVHRRGNGFQRRSSRRTWLFGIAYRVASNFRRSVRRHPSEPLSLELTSEQPNPEQHAERAEAARFVERFLERVDEGLRGPFIACVLEEMSATEAAEALGLNVNTLYSRVRVARARFAEALAERDGKR